VEADADPVPAWLATADELARSLVERARPVRFDLARTPEELEAVFRLRYRISVERGWRRAEDMPGGLERDEYDDEHAAQIAGWDGPHLAATAGVVYPVAGRPLPTEAEFGIVAEPVGRVVDAGRMIVAPEYRDGEHSVGSSVVVLWRRGYLVVGWRVLRAGSACAGEQCSPYADPVHWAGLVVVGC
jgi:hypothetical protein